MLKLIYGRTGCGKSEWIQEKICAAAAAGQKVILLTPEQISFESERALSRLLGTGMMQVEVLSFTRLCERIFRQQGGLAGRRLDQAARYMIMSIALQEVKDLLTAYQRQSANTSFITTLVDAVSELKNAGVVPGDLLQIGVDKPEVSSQLAQKTGELGHIYAAYQAIVDRHYVDPLDDMMRAAVLAEQSGFFTGYTVFLDAFTSFTAAENRLIAAMLGQADCVYATFTCDEAVEKDGTADYGVFAIPKRTALSLQHMAKDAMSTVDTPLILTDNNRYHNNDMKNIEVICAGRSLPHNLTSDHLEIACASGIYEEADYVAARIGELVRTGMRFREIVVIARDIQNYEMALQSAFSRNQIPFFTSRRADIEAQPLVTAVVAALEAVRGSFDTAQILRLAKSPVLGISPVGLAELENYCFVWSVDGATWETDFRGNPGGMQISAEEDGLLLEGINSIRRKLMGPLCTLKRALHAADGQAVAAAVYQYLVDIHAAENLMAYGQGRGATDGLLLEESGAVWDQLIGILDTFGTILQNVHFSTTRYVELLRLAFSAIDLGQLPQTVDQVLCGSADLIRTIGAKATFVLGVNEGIFPRKPAQSGIFSDRERQCLMSLGLPLAGGAVEHVLEEWYYLYSALTSSSERLFVSYLSGDASGGALCPSSIVRQLEIAFGQRAVSAALPGLEMIHSPATVEMEYAKACHDDTPFSASLRQSLGMLGRQEAVERIETGVNWGAAPQLTPETAKALFGKEMRLSPSKLDRYHECPFLFFCHDGLRLLPRQKVEYSPLESGTVIHMVLEHMLSKYGGKGLSDLTRRTMSHEISALIMDYLRERVDNLEELPMRFRHQFARLTHIIARLLQQLAGEFAQSRFEPVAFEAWVGEEGVAPLVVPTSDGGTVTVEGKIDRVDEMTGDQGRFARVVDYKSGSKKFALSDLLYGLNMQMFIYLFSLCQNEPTLLPSGVLYFPAKVEALPLPRETDSEILALQHTKSLEMDGLLLDNREALTGMEEALEEVYIPAGLTKDGGYTRTSSVATKQEFGLIKNHIVKMIWKMSENLKQGEILPFPVENGGAMPCHYCHYTAFCGHKSDDAVHKVEKVDRKAFFMQIGGDADGNA